MFHLPTARRLSAIALPMLIVAGCKDTTGLSRKAVSVSFTTGVAASAAPTASLAPSYSMSAASTPATPELPVISKVQLVLSEIELGQVSATCTGTAHGREGECEELGLDPMLVELTPGTALTSTLLAKVPVGKYTSFQAEVGPVRQDETSPGAKAFLDAHKDFVGKSVRIQGTYKGTPFVYESALRGEIEAEFAPPLEVKQDGTNITVSLDMSKWFLAADNTVIDPATATAGSANHERVARNIRRSFHAFEDNDRKGRDDRRS